MAPLKDPSVRLERYAKKRDFTRTAEPEPTIEAHEGRGFVVQKHDARNLHYDLRLELNGVLLSWAVPHGPSLVVTEKRLAVRTEDHPLKYLDFEGAIPKGEYGGGTMIVWDRGFWTPAYDAEKGLAKGHLEFELFGKRLQGRWHLVRIKQRASEKSEPWLLIKAADAYARSASEPDILKQYEASVLSGRSNSELDTPAAVRKDHKKRTDIEAARPAKLPDPLNIKGGRKALMSLFVAPALASPADAPPSGAQWVQEVKFDGYRVQARIDGEDIRLLTRSGLDWTSRFVSVAEAVKALGLGSAILDGEIIVEDAAGISNFSELVSDLKSGRQDRFRYFVFDLLYLSGVDLQKAAFVDRKETLATILTSSPASARIALSEHFETDGPRFFQHVSRLGLEGMVSKLRDAPYRSGRSNSWLKSRCVLSQEFVVIGYVPSTTSRGVVGSLVLGFYEADQLTLAGRVGTGFSLDEAAALFTALDPTKIQKSPLARRAPAEAEKGVSWVEPRLVAQVQYHGWSSDGLLRHASFRGLRDDKRPREIIRETRGDAGRPVQLHATALTHPERMLWPADGISKQGLGDYYANYSAWILPHLVGRPLSLFRCPGGITAECFFAKHGWSGMGQAIRRAPVGEKEPSLAIDDVEGLFALVQANVLEIHPWGSKFADIERPDRLIFDLDPGEGVTWSAVIEAAIEVRRRLQESLGLESFVKTTGGKGLHVVAPMIPNFSWERAKSICKSLAETMEADSPARYVANMAKSKRASRIFIDYLRNGRGATAVAAYSTRARPGAAVSIPIGWDELSEAIKSDHYRLGNIGRRMDNLARDPWAEFFKIKQRAKPTEARPRAVKTGKSPA